MGDWSEVNKFFVRCTKSFDLPLNQLLAGFVKPRLAGLSVYVRRVASYFLLAGCLIPAAPFSSRLPFGGEARSNSVLLFFG